MKVNTGHCTVHTVRILRLWVKGISSEHARGRVVHTCMWHHDEGMLHRVDKRAHDIHLFRTVQHSDQLQVVFSEELQLYVLLGVQHQIGSQRNQSARVDHEAVRRSS
jgi:hypothetical protein